MNACRRWPVISNHPIVSLCITSSTRLHLTLNGVASMSLARQFGRWAIRRCFRWGAVSSSDVSASDGDLFISVLLRIFTPTSQCRSLQPLQRLCTPLSSFQPLLPRMTRRGPSSRRLPRIRLRLPRLLLQPPPSPRLRMPPPGASGLLFQLRLSTLRGPTPTRPRRPLS